MQLIRAYVSTKEKGTVLRRQFWSNPLFYFWYIDQIRLTNLSRLNQCLESIVLWNVLIFWRQVTEVGHTQYYISLYMLCMQYSKIHFFIRIYLKYWGPKKFAKTAPPRYLALISSADSANFLGPKVFKYVFIKNGL